MTEHYLRTELYERVARDATLFDFLHEASLDGIWYLDVTNPDEMWVSHRFEETFGLGPGEMSPAGAWWRASIHPDDRDELVAALTRHVNHPYAPLDHVARYFHRDGSVVWVRSRGMAMRDQSGRVTRVLGAHTDISELKRAEQRVTLLNESFVRIASHDLGHHVRSISFGLEKLADALGPEPPAAAAEQLDRLRSKVRSTAALLRRIGDVGEMTRELRRTDVPLRELLEGAVEARDDVLSGRGALVEWPADLPTIDCDPVLMRTALMNLIVNAVTHNDRPDPRVTIEVDAGPPLEVRISDNGPGIPPAERASVFEPFSSNDAGGSGLGLTIARQVVELHGGTLDLDLDHGPGASFVIRLP